jgi:cell division protein FtsL
MEKSESIKIQSSIFLVIMLIGIGTSFYFYTKMIENKRLIVQQNKQLDEQKTALEQVQVALQERTHQVERIRDSLTAALQNVNESFVKNKTVRSQYQRLIETAKNTDYYVALYAYNVDPIIYKKGISYLQSYNFILDGYSLLEERPQWLAQQSTVFYYNKAHAEKAAEIAKYMSSLTNQKVATAIGAGTGIPKDLKDSYLSIHLINVK